MGRASCSVWPFRVPGEFTADGARMSLSSPFIHRPVGTTLLTVAITLAGALGYGLLPVSPLPQIDFPTISVNAALPGASPQTMASAVAPPLERQLGRIADITQISSASALGAAASPDQCGRYR